MHRLLLLITVHLFALPIGCKTVSPRSKGLRVEQPTANSEIAYDGRVRSGWQLEGATVKDGALRVQLKPGASIVFSHAPLTAAQYEGLAFSYQAPIEAGELFEVRVDSARAEVFPRIKLRPTHRRSGADGGEDVFVPMTELNPKSLPFDRIVLRAIDKGSVVINQVGLIGNESASQPASTSVEPRLFAIDCFAKSHKISPLIYGIALNPRKEAKDAYLWKLNPSSRRWGGNPASRYNWEVGAWNTAADYYFKNVAYGGNDYDHRHFFRDNFTHGVRAALTVPLIGWVAKDTWSVSFPTSVYPSQRSLDPETHGAGDGYSKDGKPLPSLNAERTSVPAPPQFISRWVLDTLRYDADHGSNSIDMYMLDNEPELWSSTHRDVHPAALTYDELLERTISYGEAVRKADKNALIAGPGSWGWTGYFFSGADDAAGLANKPDRLAHGDLPLLAWYLKRLHDHEEATGSHILDLLDVHFYPAARGVFGENEKADAATNALRIRSTRALWDPQYMDESWVKDTIRLIPRLKEWIARYYPGRGLCIGEYNFGGEHHMSGALALAEALGRFGEQDVSAAYYWTYPSESSPAFYAFSAYRNYDGQRATFLDNSLATRAPAGASLFAARNEDGTKITAVLLNFSPQLALDAQIDLGACGAVKARDTYVYTGDKSGFAPPTHKAQESGAVTETIPPYSITVFSLDVVPRSRTR